MNGSENVTNIDLATLSIFRMVARELSVTRAAERLGRVPSNVTTRIQQLEAELGVALFHRDKKRFSLTDQGMLFLGYAERLINLAEEARQAVKPTLAIGVLHIGSMDATAASRLPIPLARFNQAWPGIRLEVSTAPTAQLIDAVFTGRIDCALVAIPPNRDAPDSDAFDVLPLFKEELILLLPPGHAAVSDPAQIDIRSLAAFSAGCTYRAIGEDWMAGRGKAPPVTVHEVGSYHAMLACVSAGSCVSVVPRSVLEITKYLAPLTEVPLITVETSLISRRGYDTPAFKAWRHVLIDFAGIGAVGA